MGYKYSFADNAVYGSDDINAAISRLTTKGVTVYPTDENLIDAMNDITSEVATSGVDFNKYSCLVTIEDENIKISAGTAFFDDGMSIVIDSDGVTLALEYNVYVYLLRDVNRNSCYPCVSAELPESGYVLLAYIDESGNITDKREYAVSKLAPNTEANPAVFSITLEYHTYTQYDQVLATINAGYSNFRYVVFKHINLGFGGYVKLVDNDYSIYSAFYSGTYIRFKKTGQKLEIFMDTRNHTYTIDNLEILLF